jgi:hypothetical protein
MQPIYTTTRTEIFSIFSTRLEFPRPLDDVIRVFPVYPIICTLPFPVRDRFFATQKSIYSALTLKSGKGQNYF